MDRLHSRYETASHSHRQAGFTLIELMIVVAIIAIIASIAIPNLLSARLQANESAAIATLKNVASAQAQCQASGVIDVNGNGAGEYGYFAELSGGVGVRDMSGAAGTERISPPVLSGAFSNVANSRVTRSGYVFAMFLPNAAGDGLAEAPGGGVGTAPDAALSEVLWMCYAWPTSRGNSGNRAFFVNQTGDVLTSPNTAAGQLYNGSTQVPAFGAAFLQGSAGKMFSTVASNATGVDGGRWTVKS